MKALLHCNCTEKMRDLAPLVLRVVTGLIFAMHGFQKLQNGMPGVESMLTGFGFPAPALLAILLVAAELGGGILLILGLYTHWAAKILAFVAFVALVMVHLREGFFLPMGYEFILLLFAASFSLMITGPGKYSLDRKVKK